MINIELMMVWADFTMADLKELSEKSGIPYNTLRGYRQNRKQPNTWTVETYLAIKKALAEIDKNRKFTVNLGGDHLVFTRHDVFYEFDSVMNPSDAYLLLTPEKKAAYYHDIFSYLLSNKVMSGHINRTDPIYIDIYNWVYFKEYYDKYIQKMNFIANKFDDFNDFLMHFMDDFVFYGIGLETDDYGHVISSIDQLIWLDDDNNIIEFDKNTNHTLDCVCYSNNNLREIEPIDENNYSVEQFVLDLKQHDNIQSLTLSKYLNSTFIRQFVRSMFDNNIQKILDIKPEIYESHINVLIKNYVEKDHPIKVVAPLLYIIERDTIKPVMDAIRLYDKMKHDIEQNVDEI